MNKFLVVDTRNMEFSVVNLPREQPGGGSSAVVEATEGMLRMLT